jgi:plastocyanin
MVIKRTLSIFGLPTPVMATLGLPFAGSPDVASNTLPPASTAVTIGNFGFTPVTAGTTVIWTNRDNILHTVVSADDSRVFKSKVVDTNEKLSFTFTKVATYSYFCSVHPKITGTVVVK